MNSNSQKLTAIIGPERGNPNSIGCDLVGRKADGTVRRMQPCQFFNRRGQGTNADANCQALPTAFRQMIGQADFTLFASLGSDDAEIIREGLKCSAHSVMLFSKAEMRGGEVCFDLARRTTYSVFDQALLQSLTGQSDPCLGLRALMVKGVRQPTVLCRDVVWACNRGDWFKYRADGLTANACSQPAGNVFAGALIGALQDDCPFVEAIRRATGAATAFMYRKRSPRPRILSAAAAVGVGAGLMIAWLAGSS